MAAQLDPLTRVYTRLPINAEDEIRLLLLHASKLDDGIECSLVVRRREHVFDKYFALSYTWGESDCRQTITVNDVGGVPVTDNLFAALKQLRDLKTFKPRIFWVDALCINQADSTERSLQVQRMREVYHSADRVLIWLGDANYLEGHPAAGKSLKDEWFRQSLYQAVRNTTPSWWERIWVWQEFVAARKPPVFCFGKAKIESIEFKELLQSLHSNSARPKEQLWHASVSTRLKTSSRTRTAIEHIASLRSSVDNLEALRAKKKESLELPFDTMLKQTADAEATDPRDRIFSLIGFLKPDIANILKPDYTKSIGSVCAAATYAYISEKGITVALSRVRLSLQRLGQCPKPSWAIVFNTHPDFGEYTSKSFFSCVGPAIESASKSSRPLQFDREIDSLKVQGWLFDRICETVLHPSAELPPEYNGLFAKFMTTSKKVNQNEAYIDQQDWLDAYEYNQSPFDDGTPLGTSSSNPYMSISPIEAMVKDPSYRPFLRGSSPEEHNRQTKRELRSILLHRRGWMRRPWEEWDEEFERKVHNARNEWDVQHSKDTSTLHESLLKRLRAKSEDGEGPPKRWSARLNFGLYHYTDDKSICPVNFMRYTDAAMGRSAVFITNAGFVGVAPTSVSKDDVITILSGSTMPVVLRRVDDHYTFQGLSYVDGIMHGGMRDADANASTKLELETFDIR